MPANHVCDVPGFLIDAHDITLKPDSIELQALQRVYPRLTFASLRIYNRPIHFFTDTRRTTVAKLGDNPLVDVWISVRGQFDELVDWNFAHPSWRQLPPCGTRNYWTDGFGHADVQRLKSGEHALRSLYLDDPFPVLMGALLPLHFTPPRRSLSV